MQAELYPRGFSVRHCWYFAVIKIATCTFSEMSLLIFRICSLVFVIFFQFLIVRYHYHNNNNSHYHHRHRR